VCALLYCALASNSSSNGNGGRPPEQPKQQQQQQQQQQPANGGKYSHFGSELVLVQSGVCMECARQGKKRLKRTATTVYSVTDDTAGITKDDLYFAQDPSAADDFCAHSMREGSSYFKGREHTTGLFDSLAMRLSLRHFRHRMHLYEEAVRSRFEQSGTNDTTNNSNGNGDSSSRVSSATITSSNSSSSNDGSSSSSSSSSSSGSSSGSNSDNSSSVDNVDSEAEPSESATASPTVAVDSSTK
jgi:hypothetical protein